MPLSAGDCFSLLRHLYGTQALKLKEQEDERRQALLDGGSKPAKSLKLTRHPIFELEPLGVHGRHQISSSMVKDAQWNMIEPFIVTGISPADGGDPGLEKVEVELQDFMKVFNDSSLKVTLASH